MRESPLTMTELLTKAAAGRPIDPDVALEVLSWEDDRLDELFEATTAARRRRFGDDASLCSITNAKSGACGEDCIFCAQSAHHSTQIETYPLVTPQIIRERYDRAAGLPIKHFGVVTSGRGLARCELERIAEAISSHKGEVGWCASLGSLDGESLSLLRRAGLLRYHHNLETAESFFPKICTTHTYADRVHTVLAAREAGLEVCSGALFGLGETRRERVELAFALKELRVDSIPLNFLVAIPCTPAAVAERLSPEEILRTIAMFRLVCPQAEIKVCGGREVHLGEMEPKIFAAGATGMIIGGYLTLSGRSVADDLDMLRRAGMNA